MNRALDHPVLGWHHKACRCSDMKHTGSVGRRQRTLTEVTA